MAQKCKICNHPNREEIESMIKLPEFFSFADIQQKYNVNYQNIHNHQLHAKSYGERVVGWIDKVVSIPEDEQSKAQHKRLRELKNMLPAEHRMQWRYYIDHPIPDQQTKADTIALREKHGVSEEDFQDHPSIRKMKNFLQTIMPWKF